MKKLTVILILVTPLILANSLLAVTYPFPKTESVHLNEGSVMKAGTKLYLFHSGTEEVRKAIQVNDVLTVYREYPPEFNVETMEVGRVKVLPPLGDYYFNGEVIKGEVKAGDLAKKGMTAFFITSLKKNGHQL